jgi:hypothetical protein
MTTIHQHCNSSVYDSGSGDRILGIVGAQSLTLVLSKSYAVSLGIRNGDVLQVSLTTDNRLVIKKVDNKGFAETCLA